jgi:hypothetical protein
MTGTAPHHFVTVDDAIGDLPRFDWLVVFMIPRLSHLIHLALQGESRKAAIL